MEALSSSCFECFSAAHMQELRVLDDAEHP